MKIIHLSALMFLRYVSGCASVGPGRVGVLWRTHGGTEDTVCSERRYTVARPNKMYVYDLKSMNQDEPMTALTVHGMAVAMGTSLRYHLLPSDVLAVHKQVGQDYYQKLVKPGLLGETRRIFAQYTPQEIYSTQMIFGIEPDALARHLLIGLERELVLSDAEPVITTDLLQLRSSCRPCAASVRACSEWYRRAAKMGAAGVRHIRQAGAVALLQNSTACQIFGMPHAAPRLKWRCSKSSLSNI